MADSDPRHHGGHQQQQHSQSPDDGDNFTSALGDAPVSAAPAGLDHSSHPPAPSSDIATSINTARNAEVTPERQADNAHLASDAPAASESQGHHGPSVTIAGSSSAAGNPGAATGNSGESTAQGGPLRIPQPQRTQSTSVLPMPSPLTPGTPGTGRRTPAARSDDVEPFPDLPSASHTPVTPRPTEQGFFNPIPQRPQPRPGPISIRRLPSHADVSGPGSASGSGQFPGSAQRERSGRFPGLPYPRRRTFTAPSHDPASSGDPSSSSQPSHPIDEVDPRRRSTTLPTGDREAALYEAQRRDQASGQGPEQESNAGPGASRWRHPLNRKVSGRLRAGSRGSKHSDDQNTQRSRRSTFSQDYDDSIVDYLDVLDPEVSALTTLTNLQNTLFVPDVPFLNRFVNRRPTYDLSSLPKRQSSSDLPSNPASATQRVPRKPTPAAEKSKAASEKAKAPEGDSSYFPDAVVEEPDTEEREDREDRKAYEEGAEAQDSAQEKTPRDRLKRGISVSSQVQDDHYAVLPSGAPLEGWTRADQEILDDYVRHMLHSRRSKFKQKMRAFGKYASKPLGFLVTLYGTLIFLFGFAWVIFLIGWIYVGDSEKQSYVIMVVDYTLVALFAIMGDGLAPFRAIDTYHMIYIAHYHRLYWRLRKQHGVPKLQDPNELPGHLVNEQDVEAGITMNKAEEWEMSLLTPEQQRKLIHHQTKFAKSHSYYRPHETGTHFAFPLKLLITIVSLCDLHSLLQLMLGSFTWGWDPETRPNWITPVILSLSISVNITAGILISVGDRQTRKKDVWIRMVRQDLTEQAMKKVEKKKEKEAEEEERAANGEEQPEGIAGRISGVFQRKSLGL